MTRSQLITAVSEQTELSAADVERVMDSLFDHHPSASRTELRSPLPGLAGFEMRERQTKAYTNPKTKVYRSLRPQNPWFSRPAVS